MGSCGCGDYAAQWRLPGPDGIVYAIERRPGCQECGTLTAVVIYRQDESNARSWRTHDLPELPFAAYSEGDMNGEAHVGAFDLDTFKEKLWTAAREVDDDADSDEVVETIFEAVGDAVFDAWMAAMPDPK